MSAKLLLLLFTVLLFAGCKGESAADPVALGGGGGSPVIQNPNPGVPVLTMIDQLGSQLDPTEELPIRFKVYFDRPIDPAGFTKEDLVFTGTATGIEFDLTSIGDNQNFYLNIHTIATPGTVEVLLPANNVMDVFGNRNMASAGGDNVVIYNYVPLSVVIDQQPAQPDPTAVIPILYDIVFSEAIDPTTFDVTDITQGGMATGVTWNLINSGDDTNFTLEATAVGSDGSVIPTIAADLVQTVGGKNNIASTSTDNTVVYSSGIDVTIEQKVAQLDPTNVTPIEFDVVFSEAIDPLTFVPGDISQDGTATGVTWNIVNSGDNINFTLQATAVTTDGTVQPSIAAALVQTLALKQNAASISVDNSVTYDTIFDVTIEQAIAQLDPTQVTPVEFEVVFEEAIDPLTFVPADIIQNGTAVGITWNIVNSGDNINFTLQATGAITDGTIQPSLAPATVQTVSLKNNSASTSVDNVVVYDTKFDLTIEQKVAQLDPTQTVPIEFDVVFDEAIDPLTFTIADITQNGTATGITWNIINSGDNINFTLQATAVGTDGTVHPSVAAMTIQTVSLKDNNASTSVDNIVTYDTVIDVTIEQKVAQLDPTNSLPIEFDVVFDEAIDPLTFVVSDITQDGTATGITWNIINSGDDINFTLQATVVGTDGTVQPSLAASTVNTVELKPNNASTSVDNVVTYDTILPTVAIDAVTPINIANEFAYSVSGDCSENGQPVVVYVGTSTNSPVCTALRFTAVINASSEADDPALVVTADHSDAATNAALQASTTVLKDTIAATVTITGAVNINASNELNYSVVGTCSDNGENVPVSIGTINLTPICIGGAFTTGNVIVSGEPDNPSLPITADHTDVAGNPATQHAITVLKDSATPTVSIVSAPSISGANDTEYVVSGLCSDNGITVSVDIGGGAVTSSPVCTSGTWITPLLDVSGIADGPVTITADHLTATQASVIVNKDSAAPTVSISLGVNINVNNEIIYIVSGGCSVNGQPVNVMIDTLPFNPTCTNGGWTTGQQNVSAVPDGPSILITADHQTATQATATVSKDTSNPVASNLTVPSTLVNSADLNWTIVNPGGAYTIDDHVFNYRVKGTSTWLVFDDGVSATNNATVTGLLASTIYEFRVAVIYDTVNQSDWSNIAEGTTKVDDPIFDSPYKAMNVGGATTTNVVAMEDGTTVYHTPYSTGVEVTLTTLNRGDVFNFASAQYDIIDADKPIYTAGRVGSGAANAQANITWQPTTWAGKAFSFNAIRYNPQNLYVYAIEDTDITVKNGTTTLDTLSLTAGNGGVLSWSQYGSYQVNSTGTILAYHYSGNPGQYVDPKPILPSALEIIGFPSNSMRITSDLDSTNWNLIHSDSVTASGNLNKVDVNQVNPSGGGSNLYAGNSLLISADKKIAGASFADSNGISAAPFLPTNLMKTKYAVNTGSDYVAFASKQAGTIDVFDATGTYVETLTLNRTGANPNAPYKARRATTPQGYTFIATVPVAGWYQPDNNTGSSDQDETILYGSD